MDTAVDGNTDFSRHAKINCAEGSHSAELHPDRTLSSLDVLQISGLNPNQF